MSAKHVLLGLLKEGPAYPYQLEDRLDEWLGPGWRINSGQVYQTIEKLVKEGLIERVDGSIGGRDDRHVVQLTAAGDAEFERWRTKRGTSAARPLRRPVLAKLVFAGPDGREEALAEIDAYERACTERLADLASKLETIPEGARELKIMPREPAVRADDVILKLALDIEIGHYESEQQWCSYAREAVVWLYERKAIWRSGTARRRFGQDKAAQDSRSARDDLFGRIAEHSQLPPAGRKPRREP